MEVAELCPPPLAPLALGLAVVFLQAHPCTINYKLCTINYIAPAKLSKIFRIIYLQVFRPCDILINIKIP